MNWTTWAVIIAVLMTISLVASTIGIFILWVRNRSYIDYMQRKRKVDMK